MRQLAAFAQPVHGGAAYAEVLRDLGHPEQPVTPAVEDLQVGVRGRRAGPATMETPLVGQPRS